ncbi:MAG: TlpA disulfide reductase family protein [Dehalococcoidia bacterium]
MEQRVDTTAGVGDAGRPRRRRGWTSGLGSLVVSLAIVGVIVGGLLYWEHRQSATSVAPGTDSRLGVVELPAAKNPTGEAPRAEVGRAWPDFLLERLTGGTLRLSDLQGQPVVLNFWASWCPPCRLEMPELVDAYEQYRADGLVVVAVNLQESESEMRTFLDEFGVAFPVVVDRSGQVAGVWRLGGPIEGIPTSYFIDKAGVIRDFFYGPMTQKALADRLAKILPEAAR